MLSHFAFVTSLLLLSAAFEFEDIDDFDALDGERALGEPLSAAVVRAPTPNSCDGGSPLFLYNVGDFDPCRIVEKNDGKDVVLKSPENNAGTCSLSFTSEAPGFIRGKIGRAALGAADTLTYKGIFGDVITITNDNAGEKFILPSTFGTVAYSSADERSGMAFAMGAAPRSNKCQRVITAPAGSRGRLTVPGFDARRQYKAGTMCQWWITAPEGKKITLDFNAFEFGDDVTDCVDTDYIGVDTSGDKTFESASARKICGNTIPADIVSDENKINVVANGERGGVGFCLNYIVDE